jgi:hypothetical protein
MWSRDQVLYCTAYEKILPLNAFLTETVWYRWSIFALSDGDAAHKPGAEAVTAPSLT